MIASLPMYDRPETHGANNRFWSAIRARLGHGPENLTRGGDPWAIWHHPQLLLAQTCSYPYRTRLQAQVALVGTPDYGVTGCPPGYYNSVIVVRVGDDRTSLAAFARGRLAYNEALSQSGWAALHAHMASEGLACQSRLKTGSHLASAKAVHDGRADLAAIDAVAWTMMRRWDRFTDQLRVFGRTIPQPGLPLITARTNDPQKLATAISLAIKDLTATDQETLQIKNLVRLDKNTYLNMANPPNP